MADEESPATGSRKDLLSAFLGRSFSLAGPSPLRFGVIVASADSSPGPSSAGSALSSPGDGAPTPLASLAHDDPSLFVDEESIRPAGALQANQAPGDIYNSLGRTRSVSTESEHFVASPSFAYNASVDTHSSASQRRRSRSVTDVAAATTTRLKGGLPGQPRLSEGQDTHVHRGGAQPRNRPKQSEAGSEPRNGHESESAISNKHEAPDHFSRSSRQGAVGSPRRGRKRPHVKSLFEDLIPDESSKTLPRTPADAAESDRKSPKLNVVIPEATKTGDDGKKRGKSTLKNPQAPSRYSTLKLENLPSAYLAQESPLDLPASARLAWDDHLDPQQQDERITDKGIVQQSSSESTLESKSALLEFSRSAWRIDSNLELHHDSNIQLGEITDFKPEEFATPEKPRTVAGSVTSLADGYAELTTSLARLEVHSPAPSQAGGALKMVQPVPSQGSLTESGQMNFLTVLHAQQGPNSTRPRKEPSSSLGSVLSTGDLPVVSTLRHRTRIPSISAFLAVTNAALPLASTGSLNKALQSGSRIPVLRSHLRGAPVASSHAKSIELSSYGSGRAGKDVAKSLHARSLDNFLADRQEFDGAKKPDIQSHVSSLSRSGSIHTASSRSSSNSSVADRRAPRTTGNKSAVPTGTRGSSKSHILKGASASQAGPLEEPGKVVSRSGGGLSANSKPPLAPSSHVIPQGADSHRRKHGRARKAARQGSKASSMPEPPPANTTTPQASSAIEPQLSSAAKRKGGGSHLIKAPTQGSGQSRQIPSLESQSSIPRFRSQQSSSQVAANLSRNDSGSLRNPSPPGIRMPEQAGLGHEAGDSGTGNAGLGSSSGAPRPPPELICDVLVDDVHVAPGRSDSPGAIDSAFIAHDDQVRSGGFEEQSVDKSNLSEAPSRSSSQWSMGGYIPPRKRVPKEPRRSASSSIGQSPMGSDPNVAPRNAEDAPGDSAGALGERRAASVGHLQAQSSWSLMGGYIPPRNQRGLARSIESFAVPTKSDSERLSKDGPVDRRRLHRSEEALPRAGSVQLNQSSWSLIGGYIAPRAQRGQRKSADNVAQ